MTAKQADKEAAFQAELFEDSINNGAPVYDSKTKFEEYALEWLKNADIKPATRSGYNNYIRRINQSIGHIKLQNLQAHHLKEFYKNLAEDNINSRGRYATSNSLDILIKERKVTLDKFAEIAGVSAATVGTARKGNRISIESAEKLPYAGIVFLRI